MLGAQEVGITRRAEGWREDWVLQPEEPHPALQPGWQLTLPHAIAQSPLVDIAPGSTRLSCPRCAGTAGLQTLAPSSDPGERSCSSPKNQTGSLIQLPPWAEPPLPLLPPLLRIWVTHPPTVPCPGFVPHHPLPLRQPLQPSLSLFTGLRIGSELFGHRLT